MVRKFRNIDYVTNRADLCTCNACGEENFLVPYYADICPFCGEVGCMGDVQQDYIMNNEVELLVNKVLVVF